MTKAVADTSALLLDLHTFDSYEQILVPHEVLVELDKFKDEKSKRGSKARCALRHILENLDRFIPVEPLHLYADDAVISIGAQEEATVVSADVALVLRARSRNLEIDFQEASDEEELEDTFFETYSTDVDAVNGSFGILHTNRSDRLVYYWNGHISYVKEHVLKPGRRIIAPQDARQTCFIHSIFDKNIRFVAATGIPGSGKTYLALASALQLVQRGEYDKIILTVPSEHIGGKDRYGYAPGDIEDKMYNFSRGILDNFQSIMPDDVRMDLKFLKSNYDFIDVQPLYLVRGRNLDRSIVILDEGQNTDLYTMRVLATRITDQSKLVVCGDIYQSDVRYRCQIGLKQAIERFRSLKCEQPVFAHINLNHSKRGDFSGLAWKLLQ